VDLTHIKGLCVPVMMKLLTEIGLDVSRFASDKHICARHDCDQCPGAKISGGKVLSSGTKRSANPVRQVPKMTAQCLWRSESALEAFYRRLSARMDKPNANTAAVHKLARMVYIVLTQERPSLTRAYSATWNSGASAASPLPSAALQRWASRSTPWRRPHECSHFQSVS